MATELIVGDLAFTTLAREWDMLASRGMTDTPFQTLAYQKAWWSHLQPPESTLLTVVVRQTDGEAIAIGCFYNLDGTLYFNGCVEETDYLDLIVPPENAASAWEEVLECLDSVTSPAWSGMVLCNIPESSPSHTILPSLSIRRNLSHQSEIAEVCPTITLPDTFDTYLENLDSKQRREINRKLRRAEASDMTTTVVGPDDDIEQAVNRFLELLQKSTFEKRDWLTDGRRAVFHEVARAAQSAGMLQLMFTGIEDKAAAALFNFDYRNRIWVYNSGLDPAAFASLSPGVVLTAAAIEKAIQLGRSEFDFLRGNEDYKYRFGAADTRVYRHTIGRMSH